MARRQEPTGPLATQPLPSSAQGEAAPPPISEGPAAPATDAAVDQQRDHRADDRTDDAGGLERAFLRVGTEDEPAEEAADEAADDPEDDGLQDRHRVTPRDDGPRHEAGDETDHQQIHDEAEHVRLPV